MRLWHYKLIPVLPQKHLISQWRECIAIKRQWEKGTLKHPLVVYVTYHERCYFSNYVRQIVDELLNRNFKIQAKYWEEIIDFCGGNFITKNYQEHNDRYLKQCYYNLEEKVDRGMITGEEYSRILTKIKEVINE